MEKRQRSFRPGRKEVQISMSNNAGGSGMEGVAVLGGALALASLVAAFTIKKGNRQEDDMETRNLAAVDSRRQEEDGTDGLGFILQEDSTSILHLNSCSTNHGTSKIHITPIETSELVSTQSLIIPEENTMQCEREESVSGHEEIPIHDKEQESIVKTGGYGDFEEISVPVTDHKPMNVVKNESDDSFVVETIEIEIEDGGAVDADAEQSTVEEKVSTAIFFVIDRRGEIISFVFKGEEEEENSLMQSSILTEEEENYSPMALSVSKEEEEEEEEEEDEYSPLQSSVSTSEEDEDEEEYNSLMQSSVATEEEYYPRRSSFSTEEEDEEYSPTQSLSSTEEEEGEHSPMEEEEEEEEDSPLQSSYSTGEVYGEEEEYSLRQSSFSTEESEEDSPGEPSFSTDEEEEEEEEDEKDANVTETEEESSQGTWSSSTDSNVRPIWPAEMMRVLSPESKQMNISHQVSVKKFVEKDTTTNNGKNKERTQELVPINGQKEHSAKRQIWVWLGIVLPLILLLANCVLKPSDLSNSVAFVPMK